MKQARGQRGLGVGIDPPLFYQEVQKKSHFRLETANYTLICTPKSIFLNFILSTHKTNYILLYWNNKLEDPFFIMLAERQL